MSSQVIRFGSVNHIENLPASRMNEIDLGNKSPGYIRDSIGMSGIRQHLFPQVSSVFRYWQFAVWCSKFENKVTARRLDQIRAANRVARPSVYGPRSMNGVRNGARWLRGLKADFEPMANFIEEQSYRVRSSRTPEAGWECCWENLEDSSLEAEWKSTFRKTMTPAADELVRLFNRHAYSLKLMDGEDELDALLRAIVSGRIHPKDKSGKLLEAAAIYAFLIAIYGYREEGPDDPSSRILRQSKELAAVSRTWAKSLLTGLRSNRTKLQKIAQYERELSQAALRGAIWRDVWQRAPDKKVLAQLKFRRFFSVYGKSFL